MHITVGPPRGLKLALAALAVSSLSRMFERCRLMERSYTPAMRQHPHWQPGSAAVAPIIASTDSESPTKPPSPELKLNYRGRARSAYSAELSWRPLPGGPCHLQSRCDTGKVLALSGMSNLKPDKLDVGQAPAPVILNAHPLKSQSQSGKAGFIFSSKNKTLEHTKVLLRLMFISLRLLPVSLHSSATRS